MKKVFYSLFIETNVNAVNFIYKCTICWMLFLPVFCQAQVTYIWGTEEKYRKEDSLYLVWEHHFRVFTDSDRLKLITILADSITKIKKERKIDKIYWSKDKKLNDYYDSLGSAMKPMLIEQYLYNKSDSTKKQNKVFYIKIDSNEIKNKSADNL